VAFCAKLFYMKKALFFILGLLLLFHLVNIVSHYVIKDRTSYELIFNIPVLSRGGILPWMNFDGQNYLRIVKFGYESDKTLTAFYPIYPLAIKILSLNSFFNPIIIGLLISYFSSFLACLVFYQLTKNEYSEKIAFRSLFLLLIFPSSFYLFAYYTEGLFLLFSVLVFWFIRKKNILLATIFASAATATRIVGLALIPVLIFEAYRIYKKQGRFPWIITIAPAGLLAYMLYTFLKFGNPFLMIISQTDSRFARYIGFVSPVKIFIEWPQKILAGPSQVYDSLFVYPVIILEFVFAVFAIVILFLAKKKLGFGYFLYNLFGVLIIFFSGSLSSNMRYQLVLFPTFIYLAQSLSGKFYLAWSIISLIVLIFASSLFLRNYWIA